MILLWVDEQQKIKVSYEMGLKEVRSIRCARATHSEISAQSSIEFR